MKYFMIIVGLLFFSSTTLAECKTPNKIGIYIYYDSNFARDLDSSIEKLRIELSKINSLSFETRNDINAATAVGIMEGVKDDLRALSYIEEETKKIRLKAKCNETPDTIEEWVNIAEYLSSILISLNELETYQLLNWRKKCWSCEIGTVRLGQTFDFIKARIQNRPVTM